MNLLYKSIKELRKSLDKKEFSPKELFDYFKNRIEKYNTNLNSFVTTCDYIEPKKKGLLYGIPIAIKDNFCTKEIRTTASSKVLENFIPPYNATVVETLLNNGITILGKTNLDAFAHGSSTETSDFKTSANPFDYNRTAGGSSGGSANAVTSGLTTASIGSETAGSIRQPASWSGCFGLKPTYGRVSRYGLIAMASSYDCPGVLATNTQDLALLLSVISGKDPYDATSSPKPLDDYEEIRKKNKKFRIGFSKNFFNNLQSEVKEQFNKFLSALEKHGHTVKEIRLLSPDYSLSSYTITQRVEVSSNLLRFDGIRYGNNRSYFGEEAKRRIILGTYALSQGYYDQYYKKAQDVRKEVLVDFSLKFKDVDLIVAPTSPMTSLKKGEFKKYSFFGETMDLLNEPASVAGLPAINIPYGLDKNGLPIGMQVISSHFNEGLLLNIAHQFESEEEFLTVRNKAIELYKD